MADILQVLVFLAIGFPIKIGITLWMDRKNPMSIEKVDVLYYISLLLFPVRKDESKDWPNQIRLIANVSYYLGIVGFLSSLVAN